MTSSLVFRAGAVVSAALFTFLVLAPAIPSIAVDDPLAPQDVPAEIEHLVPGVKLTLLAEHPDLMTPTGIGVDDSGNVFVAASHTHFRPDNYPGPEFDEILVFDKAGKNRRVFYNKTTATMDLEVGPDGWVYLAERDRILRIRDTDGDGQADTEQDIAVLDTEADYPHNGLAGLAWHPSGDLIFSLGENYWTPWTLTGVDGTHVSGTGEGGIFRCSPAGQQLRRVARGFWNPFGVCVRSDGEMFAAENDPGARPPCRLLHVIEGGDYGYQRLYGSAPFHPFVAWNGELRGTLPMLDATGEAPCGIVPLGGGVLVPSWADHRIDFFPLDRHGASFHSRRIELVHGSDFFRPTCIVRAEDADFTSDHNRAVNTFYVCDWVYGSYELHQRGRLWKLEVRPQQSPWLNRPEPLNDAAKLRNRLISGKQMPPANQLLQLANGSDPYLARAALVALSRCLPGDDIERLRQLPEADRVAATIALHLAEPANRSLVVALLEDQSEAVQFETLRWIADERLTSMTGPVEQFLKRSDLSYQLFEAGLATWNTLNGNPRAGVSEPAMLLSRVRDPAAPAVIRAFALRLLPAESKGLTPELLRQLFQTEHPQLQQEVVRTLSGQQTPESAALLAEIAQSASGGIQLRTDAIAGLAGLVSQHADLLAGLAADENREIREEALRSLRFADLKDAHRLQIQEVVARHPDSAELATAILAPESLKENRPPLSETAAWQARLASIEGPADPAAGRRVFFHAKIGLCATCHRHSGRGGVVGPDLSAVHARGGDASLLTALLQPSRDVAPQYFPRLLQTDDGKVFTGILLRKGGRSGREFYRDDTGRERSFLKSDIVARRELKTSMMPEGLVYTLTDRELRDLLAFLQSGEID